MELIICFLLFVMHEYMNVYILTWDNQVIVVRGDNIALLRLRPVGFGSSSKTQEIEEIYCHFWKWIDLITGQIYFVHYDFLLMKFLF